MLRHVGVEKLMYLCAISPQNVRGWSLYLNHVEHGHGTPNSSHGDSDLYRTWRGRILFSGVSHGSHGAARPDIPAD